MNSRDQEKLLKEILPDSADFRETSLEHGLACLRRQRQRRVLLRAGTVAGIIAILSLGLLLKPKSPVQNKIAIQSPPQSTAPASSHVEFISDEELLALFRERPVALIGKPGQQRLVLLDKATAGQTPF